MVVFSSLAAAVSAGCALVLRDFLTRGRMAGKGRGGGDFEGNFGMSYNRLPFSSILGK